ncbi:hypothetical protein SDC9_141391 [bioreactor metagenome]|uniref:Uncharacterized protein n=1 Tax=bioreactor metagenome TaxID=1076179 RepID=A0A645DY59_9ZZZZ
MGLTMHGIPVLCYELLLPYTLMDHILDLSLVFQWQKLPKDNTWKDTLHHNANAHEQLLHSFQVL